MNEEPFITLAQFKLSLRQTLTLAMGVCVWFIALKLTVALLSVSAFGAGLICFWVLLGSFWLTFKQKNGMPYEEYLSQKIQDWLSTRL